MDTERPYEIEWPLLHTMATRTVAATDAGRILGVSPPTAETLLQHLESIGLVWRLPANPSRCHSLETRDWEITPAGRAAVEAASAPNRGRAA
jgi:hypothetical protein